MIKHNNSYKNMDFSKEINKRVDYKADTKVNFIAPEEENIMPVVKISYKPNEDGQVVDPVEHLDCGDWIDLRAAETVELKAGEFKLIPLGVAMELPKGYYAEVVPRSSTFKKYHILMANSIGVIDESYNGDNDIWRFPAYATEDTVIPFNDRICQFMIKKKEHFIFVTVDKLNNKDRGGFGSTGTN